MKMLTLSLLTLLLSCEGITEKYSVSTTDQDGFHTTYYTDSVSWKDGCVTFVDKNRGSGKITACGSVFVNELHP